MHKYATAYQSSFEVERSQYQVLSFITCFVYVDNIDIYKACFEKKKSSTTFLFGLIIISFYSALLEPCTQALQAIQLDLPQVQRHIHELLLVINLHRNKPDMHFSADIYKRVIQLSGKLNIQLTPPRQCSRQLYRNNCGATDTNVGEYFARLCISLISIH